MSINHGHSSGKYSGSPADLAKQVEKLTTGERNDISANLLTYTEVGTPDRAKKLAADGWATYSPHDQTDCAIMWKKAYWDVVDKSVKQLTDKTWKDGQGNVHHQRCTTVVLDHHNDAGKHRAWISLIHLPSGVQNGPNFSGKESHVAAWKGAVKGWADYHKSQKDKWKPDVSMYVADWNVDFKVKDWRQYVGQIYPNCVCSWSSPFPSGGTLNNRLIDATWVNTGVKVAALLKDDNASDHRPWGEIVKWN